MKRFFTFSIFVVLVVALSALPTYASGKIGFGGKAGLNLATFMGDDADGLDAKTGLAVGAYFDVPLSPTVSFHPEVLYFQKGAKEEEGGLTLKIKLDYIEIPALMMFKFPSETSQVTPLVFFGPSLGLKMSAKASGEFEGASADADIDNAKSIDFGLTVGGGAEIKVGEKNKLFVDVRYTLGLAELFDDVSNPGDNDLVMDEDGTAPSVKNGVFSILVGFGI